MIATKCLRETSLARVPRKGHPFPCRFQRFVVKSVSMLRNLALCGRRRDDCRVRAWERSAATWQHRYRLLARQRPAHVTASTCSIPKIWTPPLSRSSPPVWRWCSASSASFTVSARSAGYPRYQRGGEVPLGTNRLRNEKLGSENLVGGWVMGSTAARGDPRRGRKARGKAPVPAHKGWSLAPAPGSCGHTQGPRSRRRLRCGQLLKEPHLGMSVSPFD
jgi:hypothetical protein